MWRPALGALTAIFLTMALAGCGGGGGGGSPRVVTPPSIYASWGLPPGHGLGAGDITVAAGGSKAQGSVVVACPPGGSACVVRVSADGTTSYAVTGGVPTFAYVHPTYERDNPSAQDLLDHWNEPEQLRAALGLSPVNAAQEADPTRGLSKLIGMAGGNPAETGTKLRNVRPEDDVIIGERVEIIGERDGITYGRWTGGPAGRLNIEFEWRYAPNFDEATRARMERAGKSWSWRIRDEFGTHVAEQGREIRYNDNTESIVLDKDLPADDVLILMIDKGDAQFSSAGPRSRVENDDAYQPWLGLLRLSQRHVDNTSLMAHEIGHVMAVNGWELPPLTRYVNKADHTFEGPKAMSANRGEPVPFQWADEENRWVEPNTPGAEVDYGHLGVCTSVMAYCRDRTEVYGPSELDFAYLKDVGYDISDPDTASEPELYGYGAWGKYSAWGAGVERIIHYEGGRIIDATDTLRAAVDAFGMAPGASLAANTALQGAVTWSGSLIGVDLGQAMLPPVFGDVELEIELSTLRGTASFDDLTVHVDGMSSAFRARELGYDIGVAGNAFSDEDGHVRGSFFGPAHQEMAGVLDDRTTSVNLIAGFGGKR